MRNVGREFLCGHTYQFVFAHGTLNKLRNLGTPTCPQQVKYKIKYQLFFYYYYYFFTFHVYCMEIING
jgi:hypothetical protein